MGQRRGKLLPVKLAEIGQSGVAFHYLKQSFALPGALGILLTQESIVPLNPLLTGPLFVSRRTAENETIAAIYVARTETSLI